MLSCCFVGFLFVFLYFPPPPPGSVKRKPQAHFLSWTLVTFGEDRFGGAKENLFFGGGSPILRHTLVASTGGVDLAIDSVTVGMRHASLID